MLVSYEHYELLLKRVANAQVSEPDVEAIRNDPDLIALVEKIRATPPNPKAVHPPTESLADLLQNAPHDPDFDLETWTQQWDAIEAEMKARDRADDIAEGRF